MEVTNLQEWLEFKGSNIWKQMQEEFGVWLDDIHKQLENPECEEKVLRRLGGNAEAVRNVINFVDDLIEECESERNHPELDNEVEPDALP